MDNKKDTSRRGSGFSSPTSTADKSTAHLVTKHVNKDFEKEILEQKQRHVERQRAKKIADEAKFQILVNDQYSAWITKLFTNKYSDILKVKANPTKDPDISSYIVEVFRYEEVSETLDETGDEFLKDVITYPVGRILYCTHEHSEYKIGDFVRLMDNDTKTYVNQSWVAWHQNNLKNSNIKENRVGESPPRMVSNMASAYNNRFLTRDILATDQSDDDKYTVLLYGANILTEIPDPSKLIM